MYKLLRLSWSVKEETIQIQKEQSKASLSLPHHTTMTTPLCATRHDAHVAIASNTTTSNTIRVSLFQDEELQTTLSYRPNENNNNSIQQLQFVVGSNEQLYVAARCDSSTTTNTSLIVVWDLTRGVVAYAIDDKHVLDMAWCRDGWYWLVQNHPSHKLQIQHIQPATGTVAAKIKAGKYRSPAAALQVVWEENDTMMCCGVVASGHSLRAVDLASGKKVASVTLNTNEDHTKMGFLENKQLLVTLYGSTAELRKLPSCDLVESWSVPGVASTDGPAVVVLDAEHVLLQQRHVYRVEHHDKAPQLVATLHMDPSVDRSIVFPGHHVALYKHAQWQFQTVAIDKGTISISWKEPEQPNDKTDSHTDPKRTVALGPAQAGGDAHHVSDGPSHKKIRLSEEENVEQDGPTIAERLEQLQQALDAEESEEGEENEPTTAPFQPRKATSESLYQVLKQSLESKDDALLELALSVKDPRVMEETCQALDDTLIPHFLTALTTRVTTTPARAEHLVVWIRTILLKHNSTAGIQPHLQALRNLVQERLEVFPAWLQLEGRLSQMKAAY